MLKTQEDSVFTNTDDWIDILRKELNGYENFDNKFNDNQVVEFAHNFIKDKLNIKNEIDELTDKPEIKNETDELKNKTFQTEHYTYVINWLRKNKIIQLYDQLYPQEMIYVPIRDNMSKPEILCEIIKQHNVNKEKYFFDTIEIMTLYYKIAPMVDKMLKDKKEAITKHLANSKTMLNDKTEAITTHLANSKTNIRDILELIDNDCNFKIMKYNNSYQHTCKDYIERIKKDIIIIKRDIEKTPTDTINNKRKTSTIYKNFISQENIDCSKISISKFLADILLYRKQDLIRGKDKILYYYPVFIKKAQIELSILLSKYGHKDLANKYLELNKHLNLVNKAFQDIVNNTHSLANANILSRINAYTLIMCSYGDILPDDSLDDFASYVYNYIYKDSKLNIDSATHKNNIDKFAKIEYNNELIHYSIQLELERLTKVKSEIPETPERKKKKKKLKPEPEYPQHSTFTEQDLNSDNCIAAAILPTEDNCIAAAILPTEDNCIAAAILPTEDNCIAAAILPTEDKEKPFTTIYPKLKSDGIGVKYWDIKPNTSNITDKEKGMIHTLLSHMESNNVPFIYKIIPTIMEKVYENGIIEQYGTNETGIKKEIIDGKNYYRIKICGKDTGKDPISFLAVPMEYKAIQSIKMVPLDNKEVHKNTIERERYLLNIVKKYHSKYKSNIDNYLKKSENNINIR